MENNDIKLMPWVFVSNESRHAFANTNGLLGWVIHSIRKHTITFVIFPVNIYIANTQLRLRTELKDKVAPNNSVNKRTHIVGNTGTYLKALYQTFKKLSGTT